MGIGVESCGAVMIEEPAPRSRRLAPPARRAVFLLGTSLFVYAALPTAAIAQTCGTPPPGENTVHCDPGGNPYSSGITYTGVVEDLTVVLDPGVRVNDTVRMTSSGLYADLGLVGPTDTAIYATAPQHPGAFVHADASAAYVSLDTVRISGDGTRSGSPAVTHYNAAADVSARNGATIFVNNASSSGKYSAGVLTNSSGSPTCQP